MPSRWFCESRSCSTAAAAPAAAAEAGCGAADPSARRVVLNAAHCTWEMLDITLARKHERVSASTDGCGSVGRPGDDSGGRQRCRADQVQSSISEWNQQRRNATARKWRRCRSCHASIRFTTFESDHWTPLTWAWYRRAAPASPSKAGGRRFFARRGSGGPVILS